MSRCSMAFILLGWVGDGAFGWLGSSASADNDELKHHSSQKELAKRKKRFPRLEQYGRTICTYLQKSKV